MTDVQSATVQRVKVIFGEDDDAYVVDGTGHELENDDNEFVADVPAELWTTEQDAYRAWRRASAAVIEAVGIDVDERRLTECCPRWKGYTTPPSEHWDVYVARPDSERGDRRIGWEATEEAAQAIIDALPEVFYEHGYGSGYREIHRDWLRVEKAGWSGSTSNCYRCGWDRAEHVDQGEPTPPKRFPSRAGKVTMRRALKDQRFDSRAERLMGWLRNHHLILNGVYSWFLDRRCPDCGERRFEHPFGEFCPAYENRVRVDPTGLRRGGRR